MLNKLTLLASSSEDNGQNEAKMSLRISEAPAFMRQSVICLKPLIQSIWISSLRVHVAGVRQELLNSMTTRNYTVSFAKQFLSV